MTHAAADNRSAPLRDLFVWPAVVCFDAVILLNAVTCAFLVRHQFGGDYAELARVGAAYWVVYSLLCPLTARAGRRIGLRRAQLAGAAVMLAAAVLMTRAGSVWQVAGAMGLTGAGGSLFWPNLEAELARGHEGPLLRRRLAVFGVMWCFGTAVGPFVGAMLYPDDAAAGAAGREAINLCFYAAVALAIGVIVCIGLWRPRRPRAEAVRRHLDAEAPRDPARLHTFMLMAFVANFASYVVLSVLRQIYPRLADEQWAGLDPAGRHFWLLVLLASASTVTFAVLIVAHRWSYRLKRLIGWQVVMIGAVVVVGLAREFAWAVAGFVAVGVASSFIYSGSLFYSVEDKDETSHMAGWHETMIGLGCSVGILLCGHLPGLLRWIGIGDADLQLRSPYLLAAALFAAGIVVQLALYARRRHRFADR